MNFQAMAWAVKQKVGNATGKAILLMLANYADEQGQCFPSQNTLASECECSTRAVSNWLSKFEDMGIITRESRHGQRGYRTSDFIQLDLNNQHARRSPEYNSCENGSIPTCTTFHSNMHDVQSNNLSVKQSDNLSDTKARADKKQFEREFNEIFWPAYPHKVGKPKALTSFLKARSTDSLQNIIDGLRRYIDSKPPDRSWLNPTTFLNQERWNDQPATIQTGNGNGNTGNQHKPTLREQFQDAFLELGSKLDAKRNGDTIGEFVSGGIQNGNGFEQSGTRQDQLDHFSGKTLSLVASK